MRNHRYAFFDCKSTPFYCRIRVNTAQSKMKRGLKMFELVTIFCMLCALPDVGALIVAFVHRKNLNCAKVISTLGYVYRLKEAELTNETMPLNDEDVERLKRRHSVIAGLGTLPIALSAMGSLMIILGFQNNPDSTGLYSGYYD